MAKAKKSDAVKELEKHIPVDEVEVHEINIDAGSTMITKMRGNQIVDFTVLAPRNQAIAREDWDSPVWKEKPPDEPNLTVQNKTLSVREIINRAVAGQADDIGFQGVYDSDLMPDLEDLLQVELPTPQMLDRQDRLTLYEEMQLRIDKELSMAQQLKTRMAAEQMKVTADVDDDGSGEDETPIE